MSVYLYQAEILAAEKTSPNSRGWVRLNCPACVDRVDKPDRKKSCGFNVNTGGVNCFRCGLAGYVQDYGTGPEGARFERSSEPAWSTCEPPPGFLELSHGPGLNERRYYYARQYLLGRHVPEATWSNVGLGVCDAQTLTSFDPEVVKMARRMNGRVVVPVREPDGRWRGYVGRAYYPNPARSYMNHPGPWREGTVWNSLALLEASDKPLLVTEGLFDALPSYPNSVALLGKPTEQQERLLLSSLRPVCMLLDGDAWRLSKATALKLHVRGQRVGFVKLPAGEDPNDLDPNRLMDAAVESVQTQRWLREIH